MRFSRRGLSLIELVVVVALLGVVGATIGSALLHHQRFYGDASGLLHARESVRDAMEVLSTDIRFRRHQMRNKKGFTLIELLIVVVIIGILAAIAIPKFANTKEKAYVATMKSDLRNLATYEEQYAADTQGVYFPGTATYPSSMQGFSPSSNVTVTASTVAGPPPSWSGTASHSQTAKTCKMVDGVITCT